MAQTPDITAARRFLRGGEPGRLTDEALLQVCERLIQETARTSFTRAVKLARRFVDRSQGRSQEMRVAAIRALARWTHMSGNHREALRSYLKARRMLARDRAARGRIDRALIDVHMYLGDFASARRAAVSAMNAFKALASDNDLAQTKVNLANVLHRQDRHREAARLYREASAYFARSGNEVAAARTNYNWANALVQLFEFDSAERLYTEAERTYRKCGYDLDACDARYGLAWLRMLRGDFHLALRDLAACEETYCAGGDPRGEALCILDRAEVFVYLGLYGEALETSRLAERRFRKLRLRYETSKAELFHGQAAAALGLRRQANAALERSRQGFTAEKNGPFLGLCSLLESDLSRNDAEARCSLRKARAAFARAELPLWQAVCDLHPSSERSDPVFIRLSRNQAVRAVPHLFAQWQTRLGDHLYASGRHADAREHWRKAADRIDSVRAQLPPVGLRGPYGVAYDFPHRRLIDYELSRRPLLAATWSERHKTVGLWSPLANLSDNRSRRRVDQALDRLARQVAAFSSQAGVDLGARGSGRPGRGLTRMLEQRIREEMAGLERQADRSPDSEKRLASRIADLSRRIPILQFHLTDTDIVAFIHRGGTARVVAFEHGRERLASLMGRLRFFVQGELLPGYPGADSRLTAETALWNEFGTLLWQPLHLDCETEVLVIPEGETANIPWQAISVQGQPIGDRCRFLLAPSIRHFLAAERRRARSQNVRLFRGAAKNLPSVDAELVTLGRLLGSEETLITAGSRSDWPETDDAAVWHFSGHAHMNRENPFYSYLLMSDGPLFAADFRLRQCTVDLVTLAACRSGEQIAIPGEEATGLVRSLLEMGARSVVAPHWPVADAPAAAWMSAFYTHYVDHKDVLAAARQAARTVRQSYPSACHWAAFSVFGAGRPGGSHAN